MKAEFGRYSVLGDARMAHLYRDVGVKSLYVDRKMTYAMRDQGQFVKELDSLSEMIAMRLLPADRLDLAEQVLSNMLRTGRALPDTTAMLRSMEKVTNLELKIDLRMTMASSMSSGVGGGVRRCCIGAGMPPSWACALWLYSFLLFSTILSLSLSIGKPQN